MAEKDKKKGKKTKEANSTDIISIDEATAETVFFREFANLKKGLEDQQKLSWQIVIGVAIAFIFTIGLVAIEIMLFHTRNDKDFIELQQQYFQDVRELRNGNFDIELRLQKEIDNLKTKETIEKNNQQL